MFRKSVQKLRAAGSLHRAKGSGRKRCTSATGDQKILLDKLRSRGVTSKEVLEQSPQTKSSPVAMRRRACEADELKSCWKTKKPLISDTSRRKRMKWCKAHQHWTEDDWSQALWSGESPFALRLSRKARAWCRHSERYKRWATTAAAKHDVKVSVRGCFAAYGVGSLYLAGGTADKHQYREVVTHQVVPPAQRLSSLGSLLFSRTVTPRTQ